MACSTIACGHVHGRIKYGGVLCSQNAVMLVELMLVTSHRALFLIWSEKNIWYFKIKLKIMVIVTQVKHILSKARFQGRWIFQKATRRLLKSINIVPERRAAWPNWSYEESIKCGIGRATGKETERRRKLRLCDINILTEA